METSVPMKRFQGAEHQCMHAGEPTQELSGVYTAVPAMAWWHTAVKMAKWQSSRSPCCRTVATGEPTRLLQVRVQAGLEAALPPVLHCEAKWSWQQLYPTALPLQAATCRLRAWHCSVCLCCFSGQEDVTPQEQGCISLVMLEPVAWCIVTLVCVQN